jgi:hypothetical protein
VAAVLRGGLFSRVRRAAAKSGGCWAREVDLLHLFVEGEGAGRGSSRVADTGKVING